MNEMSSTRFSIEVDQCSDTEDHILSFLKGFLCIKCLKIPLPPKMTRFNDSEIYCLDCFIGKGGDSKTLIKIDEYILDYLKELKFECKNKCGTKYKYETRDDLEEHEQTCKFKPKKEFNVPFNFPKSDMCKDCQTIIQPNHNCILELSNKIDKLQQKFSTNESENKNKSVNEKPYKIEELFLESKNTIDRINQFEDKFKNHEIQFKTDINKFNKLIERFQIIQNECIANISEKIKIFEKTMTDLEEKIKITNQEIGKIRKNDNPFNNAEILSNNEHLDDIIHKNQVDQKTSINLLAKKFNFDEQKRIINETFNQKIMKFESKHIKDSKYQDNIVFDSLIEELKDCKKSLKKIFKLNDAGKLSLNSLSFTQKLNHLISQQSFGSIDNIMKLDGSEISSLVIHNKNTLIAGLYESIKIWDISTNSLKGEIDKPHEQWITSMLVLKNKKVLLSTGYDFKIKFWNIDTASEASKEINNKSFINSMIQYDDDTIVVGSSDRSIHFYNLNNKELKRGINTDHTGFIYGLFLININSKNFILSSSYDKSIKVWDNNEKCTNTLRIHQSTVTSLLHLKNEKNKSIISVDREGSMAVLTEKFIQFKYFKKCNYDDDETNNHLESQLIELHHLKLFVLTTSSSTITFWDSTKIEILRKIKLKEGIKCLLKYEGEDKLIFNIGNEVIIWK